MTAGEGTTGMEPALDVLHRALQGDEGARSFLDQTSSIYVLDVTDLSKPHTYGCWNFIHQAMNEVERAESHRGHQEGIPNISFVPHAQLLATMALRVARRSNVHDKRLVATCIENASKYHGTPAEAQKLIDINTEIRDIVMGRLAALALDPTFHRNTKAGNYISAFSDTVVLETFCAVLAANACSNGPAAVRHLVAEWIIPSSKHLPPFCLTCITLHLAEEAARRVAPAGIQDVLQQLSTLVIAGVLTPCLTGAIKESSPEAANTKVFLSNGLTVHEMNCRIAGLSLRAINQWCAVTDLSLAQIKHICTKVRINIIDTLNDAMYSDSRFVVDALAEFMECVMERHQVTTVSENRMNQVRHIMQVDEESFRSNITAEQLMAIESKEMAVILDELVSSIGLQRFRFVDRQTNGEIEVCRNLARMAASICDACRAVSTGKLPVKAGPGLIDLLLKAAGHPSVDVSGIALEVLTEEINPESGVVHQLLPILQGRAIAPHRFLDDNIPSIIPEDAKYHDSFEAFEDFRLTSLTDCLEACWKAQPDIYMNSCVAAIEEFCQPQAYPQLSFHLEAALFCVSAVSEVAQGNDIGTHLAKCLRALSLKPASLTTNPLTLARACHFVEKYSSWFVKNPHEDMLDAAADLALSTFNLCASDFFYTPASEEMKREANISVFKESSKAMKALLVQSPNHFTSSQAITSLGAGWEASFAAANRTDILSMEDREAMCEGICYVVASLPEEQRGKSLLALTMPSLHCLEAMLGHANDEAGNNNKDTSRLESILGRLSSELKILSCAATSFAKALAGPSRTMGHQETVANTQPRATIREPALSILHRAWPSITDAAYKFNHIQCLAFSVDHFLSNCLPKDISDDHSVRLVKEICQLGVSIVEHKQPLGNNVEEWNVSIVSGLCQTLLEAYGNELDDYARATINPRNDAVNNDVESRNPVELDPLHQRAGTSIDSILLTVVDGIQPMLGSTWNNAERQHNGQPPFETKSPAPDRTVNNGLGTKIRSAGLPFIFQVLTVAAHHCGIYLLQLPAAKEQDRKEDLLLHRAVEAATNSLLDSDALVAERSMLFLESVLALTTSMGSISPIDHHLRQTLEEILSPVRQPMLNSLIMGICGRFSSGSVLAAASKLFGQLLSTYSSNVEDCRAVLLVALSRTNTSFRLGQRARSVTMECFFQCCQGQVHADQLYEFLEQILDLHQSSENDMDDLSESDSVLRFCQRYSRR